MISRFFFDLETHPDLTPGALKSYVDAVEAPSQYKLQDSIDKWKDANALRVGTENWSRSALDPMRGGIYVIGFSMDGETRETISRKPEEPEGPFLAVALSALAARFQTPGAPSQPRWIGYNCLNFDLPFLAKRCAIHGITPALRIPVGMRYNNDRVTDLMQTWCGFKEYAKQKDVAAAMGFVATDDIDGKDLWAAVQKGGVEVAIKKCKADLDALIHIHGRMAPIFGV